MHRRPDHAPNILARLIDIFLRFMSRPFWSLLMSQLIDDFIKICKFFIGSSLCLILLKNEEVKKKRKMAWWAKSWKSMRENFHQFYTITIYGSYYTYDFKQKPIQFKFLNNFRLKYLAIIKDKEVELTDWLTKRFEAIWADQAYNKANISISEAHIAVRKQLVNEFFEKLFEMLVNDLASHIWITISSMIDFIHNQMFLIDINKIKLLLLADTHSDDRVLGLFYFAKEFLKVFKGFIKRLGYTYF